MRAGTVVTDATLKVTGAVSGAMSGVVAGVADAVGGGSQRRLSVVPRHLSTAPLSGIPEAGDRADRRAPLRRASDRSLGRAREGSAATDGSGEGRRDSIGGGGGAGGGGGGGGGSGGGSDGAGGGNAAFWDSVGKRRSSSVHKSPAPAAGSGLGGSGGSAPRRSVALGSGTPFAAPSFELGAVPALGLGAAAIGSDAANDGWATGGGADFPAISVGAAAGRVALPSDWEDRLVALARSQTEAMERQWRAVADDVLFAVKGQLAAQAQVRRVCVCARAGQCVCVCVCVCMCVRAGQCVCVCV